MIERETTSSGCMAGPRVRSVTGWRLSVPALARSAAAVAGVLAALVLAFPAEAKTAAKDFMIKAQVAGRYVEGRPLSWSRQSVYLLARDGQLIRFRPEEARDFHKSSPRFYSYTTGEIRSQLYEEFGRSFEVTGTGHYLVVHPAGQQDRWAERFEKLYRSFHQYFRVRGFELNELPYPLVAVVLRNRADYVDYCTRAGSPPGANTLGHYDDWTNRIYLYDVTADRPEQDWSLNAETIIHEATHQTAFNAGIHTRFAGNPRWLCEGLATLSEARGVWEGSSHLPDSERINRRQLAAFQKYRQQRRRDGSLTELLAEDRFFRSDEEGAYAEAWALTYYLSETRPRLYSDFLARTASRPAFEEYSAADRVGDFQSIFGENLKMVEIEFLRFMDGLQSP